MSIIASSNAGASATVLLSATALNSSEITAVLRIFSFAIAVISSRFVPTHATESTNQQLPMALLLRSGGFSAPKTIYFELSILRAGVVS